MSIANLCTFISVKLQSRYFQSNELFHIKFCAWRTSSWNKLSVYYCEKIKNVFIPFSVLSFFPKLSDCKTLRTKNSLIMDPNSTTTTNESLTDNHENESFDFKVWKWSLIQNEFLNSLIHWTNSSSFLFPPFFCLLIVFTYWMGNFAH